MPHPERTCIGCRVRSSKSALIRVVWQPEVAAVTVDEKQSLRGRGAYVHLSLLCLEKGQRRVRGALRIPSTIDWNTVSEPWASLRTIAKID